MKKKSLLNPVQLAGIAMIAGFGLLTILFFPIGSKLPAGSKTPAKQPHDTPETANELSPLYPTPRYAIPQSYDPGAQARAVARTALRRSAPGSDDALKDSVPKMGANIVTIFRPDNSN